MQSPVWQAALRRCAAPSRARHYYEDLAATDAGAALHAATAEQARVLAALFSGSQALSEWLVTHPAALEAELTVAPLEHPRRSSGLRRDLRGWLDETLAAQDYAEAFARLREFKQRQMLRIAARDLGRLGETMVIVRELSDVADVCLEAAFQICWAQLTGRFGHPYHLDADERWQPTAITVLGLGKLGGHELNYSSDVDLMFVYSAEGFVFKEPPRRAEAAGKGLSNHQFFQRLIEAYVSEVTRLTAEGSLYRVDLRLRPEGNTGPVARSLESYENYYAQWGQTWERMMLLKARGVAGDAVLAAEFLELVQSFRYPRSLADRIVHEVAEMKQRIENEVVGVDEIERNVKLGQGGIREIEFVVQTLQVLNGGRQPFLQASQTLPALDKLVQYRLLPRDDANALADAYTFLRDVEHRLQMENNLQTHTIPTDSAARERLARLMGCDSLRAFEQSLQQHTRNVRHIYGAQLKIEAGTAVVPLPQDFQGQETAWRQILADHSFKQIDKSLRVLQTFVQGPGYVHVSPRTSGLALQLVARLLALCPCRQPDGNLFWPDKALSDPDRVVARLDTYISVYGARSTLYEAWASNPMWFELLVLLFDRSEFLAETAIRTPDLVEDLVESGQLRRRKTAAQILEDLQHGRRDEDQRLWLRRYHQAEFMRLGLRDILGLVDFEQNLVELTALADACLQYALEIALRQHRLKRAPFAIVGLGKLGGAELTYGSDLDITFVADPKAKNLPALQRLAAAIMDLLSSPTELGVAFPTDTRLRPDGEKGLLVNTLPAYARYYRERAMLWEIQALSRTRPIAGDLDVGAKFHRLAGELANFQSPRRPPAAYRPDWKQEIARMRARIEKERTPAGKDPLAIKTGRGGLIDAEFIAQTFCLAHGWQEANTLRALERARDGQVLPQAEAARLIENYRKLRRIEGILRRWSYVGETVMPDDPAPLYRVSVRCGFHDADAFLIAVGEYRAAIREVYDVVFAAR